MTRRHRRSAGSRRLFEEVEVWSGRLGTRPFGVYVQAMTKKWASCRPAARTVYLSLDLIDQPKSFRDAVIVHELLHLRLANHGRLFKSLMDAFVPGWAEAADVSVPRVCGGRH